MTRKYINICQKLLNFFHLISTFSGFPTFHILSIFANFFRIQIFWSFYLHKFHVSYIHTICLFSPTFWTRTGTYAGNFLETLQVFASNPTRPSHVINLYRISKLQVFKISLNILFFQIRKWSNCYINVTFSNQFSLPPLEQWYLYWAWLIAHRAAWLDVPENSLETVKVAA